MEDKFCQFQKFKFCKYKEHCMKNHLSKKRIQRATTKIIVKKGTLKPAKEKYQNVDLRETVTSLTKFYVAQIKLKVMAGLTYKKK